MDIEKKFDEAVDKGINFFRKLIEIEFDRIWFTWLEWVTISAAIYAVGRKTESPFIIAVSLFSGALLFFKGWIGAERFIVKNIPKIAEKKKPFLFWLVVLVIAMIPFAVMLFLGGIFRGLIQ